MATAAYQVHTRIIVAGVSEAATKKPVRPVWVTGFSICAFRGIPDELTISIGDAERPTSVLILGDNGSGKSSITDALQFGLQGELRGMRGVAIAEAALSRASTAQPRVRVDLSDGSMVDRGFRRNASDRLTPDPGAPAPGFGRIPLVVRRRDILRFWDTPAAQRQLILSQYFEVGPGRERETPDERITRLKAERITAKTRRNGRLRELATHPRVEAGSIPSDARRFNLWVDNFFYGGFDPKTRRFRQRRKLSAAILSAIEESRAAIKLLSRIESELKAAQKLAASRTGDPELTRVLEAASADLTTAFNEISPRSAVESLGIEIGDETAVALDVRVRLRNGREVDPQVVLSEANQDLIAFLVFVVVAKAAAARGEAKVLVFDDVFQSVDSPIRLAALSYVLGILPGWQLIITAHDRLWREQVAGLFQRLGRPLSSLEIVDWTLEHGPRLRRESGEYGASLRAALTEDEPAAIAAQAGRLLEQISDQLSSILVISVKRKPDDRYTLADLWPGVKKALSKTNASAACQEIDLYLHLRNFLGAHANPWAEGASRQETQRFAEAVLELLVLARCSCCGRWVERTPNAGAWVCRCGVTRLAPPEPDREADPAEDVRSRPG
ncbi:MAG: hypothetical protein JWO14_2289 [Solirubrobacterales bacterium]|nr:hypothetical protein [Solirubrobacterales bacterium]